MILFEKAVGITGLKSFFVLNDTLHDVSLQKCSLVTLTCCSHI